MTRYTYTLARLPGQPITPPFEAFVAHLTMMLKPCYLRRRVLVACLAQQTAEAREASGFEGDFRVVIQKQDRLS